MALKSGLSLYCYTLPTSTPPFLREYRAEIEALRFTTVNPGGYGQLTAILKLRDARQPRPELGIFSRLMLVGHGETGLPFVIGPWEISDPDVGMNKTDGEFVKITALGLGNCLRDLPGDGSYNNQTVQQIARGILATYNSTNGTYLVWPIDPDNSQVFPDNPAGTYSPAYNGRTFEEELTDLCTLASAGSNIYTWWTQGHSKNVDAAGFPTLQLYAKLRDTATTHYQASITAGEIEEYDIQPSAERAYNSIGIDYNNGSGGVSTYYARDPRLNLPTLAQGNAPFRFRQLFRDLSGTSTVNAAQAAAIAQMYLAQYENITNKVRLLLRNCRDGASGNPIPLWALSALNHNIWINEMAIRGQQLPSVPTPGVNQFYVLQTTYTELASGDTTCELQCDNWYDSANAQVARLSLAADAMLRGNGVTAVTQAPGAPMTGQCGAGGTASAGGQTAGAGTNFAITASNVPTSITLTQLQNNNVSGEAVQNITAVGFYLKVTAAAAGSFDWAGTYKTVGNCLLEVDERAGTFAHHCDGCEQRARRAHGCHLSVARCAECQETATRRGLRLAEHLRYERGKQGRPHESALGFACPECGQSEHYNTQLSAEDEQVERNTHRAEQARLIRAAMRGLGMEVLD